MDPILVTSTAEATGKTAVSLALAKLAQEQGYDVGYMKPKGTRLQSATGKTRDEDPMLARELLDLDAEMHELEPIVYTPTFVEEAIRGRERPEELRNQIRDLYEQQAAENDLVVLEGTHYLTTGGVVELTDLEIAAMLDARVILMTRYEEPGDIDDVLAASKIIGDEFSGVLFNAVPDTAIDQLTEDALPFLETRDVPILGVMPRVRELAGMTVSEFAEIMGADVLTAKSNTDQLIGRFLVGAMSGEGALSYFRRVQNAAVVTGGDRSDIIRTALEASGIKCIVLSGGYRPASAVIGEAEKKGVPILLVQSDTQRAIDRAEEVLETGPTRRPETIETMQSLLADHSDVDGLLSEE